MFICSCIPSAEVYDSRGLRIISRYRRLTHFSSGFSRNKSLRFKLNYQIDNQRLVRLLKRVHNGFRRDYETALVTTRTPDCVFEYVGRRAR